MDNTNLLPPLRLILNSNCNGMCSFCHREGCTEEADHMSIQIIDECIEAAKELNISKISLTGGEPTLRKDLGDIIQKIKKSLPDVELGITTNGYGLSNLSCDVLELLDHISLSIISFDKRIYMNYQGVCPTHVLDFLAEYKHKTTVNVVVVDDNKNELLQIIERCFALGFNVDVLFELFSDDQCVQIRMLAELTEKYDVFSIQYGSTPVMLQFVENKLRLRIKAPSISSILKRNICSNCVKYDNCPEKVCALRVYPNGVVTPCLNGYVQSSKKYVRQKIKEIYPKLQVSTENIYSFFFS